MTVHRGMDRAALDAAYNNGKAVPESAQIVAGWEKRAAALRAAPGATLDVRYGEAQRNRIDYFEAKPGAPLLVFIHGGYWQSRAKELFAFLVEGPMTHGLNVALVGYTLAPEKRLDAIVAEIRLALDFIARKYSPSFIVSGWSAGGHLTAMAMDHPAVKAGIAISGVYDLEPCRLNYLNEKLGLDEAEARRNSPMLHPPASDKPLVLAYGTGELPELQRQSEEFFKVLKGKGKQRASLQPLAKHNHFTILDELASAEGALARAARSLAFPA